MGFIGQRTRGGVNKVWKEKAELFWDSSGQSETRFLLKMLTDCDRGCAQGDCRC